MMTKMINLRVSSELNLYVRDLRDTSTSTFAIEAYNSFLSVVPAKCSLVTDQHCLPLQRLLSKAKKKKTNKQKSKSSTHGFEPGTTSSVSLYNFREWFNFFSKLILFECWVGITDCKNVCGMFHMKLGYVSHEVWEILIFFFFLLHFQL